MRHYSVVPVVVKRFLTGFCFSALAILIVAFSAAGEYLPQGLQTGDRVPDDIHFGNHGKVAPGESGRA